MKILIADNLPLDQFYLSQIIEIIGHHCIIKTNGRDAIDYLKKNSVDVIILYAEMSEISGLDVAKHIKTEMKLKTPLIAITAHCFDDYKKKIINAGFDYTLIKPFLIDDLAVILKVIQSA